MAEAREAWITGIGIISCLGEGPQAHWQKLMQSASERRHDDIRTVRRASAGADSISTYRFRKRAISARWKTGSASAPMPPVSHSTSAGLKGKSTFSRAWT